MSANGKGETFRELQHLASSAGFDLADFPLWEAATGRGMGGGTYVVKAVLRPKDQRELLFLLTNMENDKNLAYIGVEPTGDTIEPTHIVTLPLGPRAREVDQIVERVLSTKERNHRIKVLAGLVKPLLPDLAAFLASRVDCQPRTSVRVAARGSGLAVDAVASALLTDGSLVEVLVHLSASASHNDRVRPTHCFMDLRAARTRRPDGFHLRPEERLAFFEIEGADDFSDLNLRTPPSSPIFEKCTWPADADAAANFAGLNVSKRLAEVDVSMLFLGQMLL